MTPSDDRTRNPRHTTPAAAPAPAGQGPSPRHADSGVERSRAGSNYGDMHPLQRQAGPDPWTPSEEGMAGTYTGSGYMRERDAAGNAPDAGEIDPLYRQWREQQLRRLDEDYRAWRHARAQPFSAEDFERWRRERDASGSSSAVSSTSIGTAGGGAG